MPYPTRTLRATEPAPTQWQVACLIGSLVLFEAVILLFAAVDWGHGLARTGLLAVIGMGLLATRWWPAAPRRGPRLGPAARKIIVVTAAGLGLMIAGFMAETLYHTATTGDIRLDQGQNSYRAALALLKGENPYGRGALLDPYAYEQRLPRRIAAGDGPRMAPAQIPSALQEYWRTQDPKLRRALLPEAKGDGDAAREASLLGYKYGPVILLATAALVPVFGALSVPLGNIAAVAILLGAAWFILRRMGVDAITATIALCALMLDLQIVKNFIFYSATDIWALMFGFLALLAALRGHRFTPALLVGLAIGAKLVPGVLFLPVLLLRPSLGAFCALCASLLLPMLPWLILDAPGFFLNVLLWGGLMEPDPTSWAYFAPHGLVLPLKLAAGCAAAAAALFAVRDMRRGKPWFWAMGLMAGFVILLGSVFHNNYLPWVSVWVVLAMAQRQTAPILLADSADPQDRDN